MNEYLKKWIFELFKSKPKDADLMIELEQRYLVETVEYLDCFDVQSVQNAIQLQQFITSNHNLGWSKRASLSDYYLFFDNVVNIEAHGDDDEKNRIVAITYKNGVVIAYGIIWIWD